MKKFKKALVLFLCAVLLVVGSVMGTLAYLTSNDTVTNTFTVGDVLITLDETDVDVNGVKDGDTRVKANDYKLMPGHTYIKDPVVHVDAASENCFLYVKVNNPLVGIEADTKIADQMVENGWTLLNGSTDTYFYKDVCGAGFNISTFTQFTIRGDIQELGAYDALELTVTAYAVQQDGFNSAQAAWDATFGA